MEPIKKDPIDMVWKSEDLIGLTVTLASKSGKSLHGKTVRVTKSNLEYFVPEKSKIREAKNILAKAGFRVIAESRLGLSIIGEKTLIEKYFSAKIDAKTIQVPHAKKSVKIRMPQGELKIPVELQGIVEKIKFEQYPIPLAESATPPNPGNYHLHVPADITRILGADPVHSCGYTGSGVKVCMLDDGFYTHAYYTEQGYDITLIPVGLDAVPPNKGHGTAIASNLLAMAPDAEFIFLNAMIWIFSVATAAFRRAKQENPDVITCSWGMESIDADLEWEIVDAVNNGIVVVFACGNGGPIYFPGCMDEVISAGGVFPEENGGFHASSYASSGEFAGNPGRQCPDVCGLVGDADHGVLIMMPTVPDAYYDKEFSPIDGTATDDGWIVASGTSSAAPQIAGVAALLLQYNPALTPTEVRTLLCDSARDISAGNSASGEAAGPGMDLATGHGLVNAQRALEAVGLDCNPCGFHVETNFCLKKSEVDWCLSRIESNYCLKIREANPCFMKIEACVPSLISCRPAMMTCNPGRMIDDSGCGPVSLIVNDFDQWTDGPYPPYKELPPVVAERLRRFRLPSEGGMHTRRLSGPRQSRGRSR